MDSLRDGAGDRTRTGMPIGGGFSSHYGFRRQRGCSCAGLCLHRGHSALGAPRLVSTPSQGYQAWLGVVSPTRAGISPNLRGFTRGLSLPGAQSSKSAVSTISPPRQWAEGVHLTMLVIRCRAKRLVAVVQSNVIGIAWHKFWAMPFSGGVGRNLPSCLRRSQQNSF